MITLVPERLVRYERLMRRISDESFDISEDFLCEGCKFHRPDWEYRFCLFTECPKINGFKTFWEVARNGTE